MGGPLPASLAPRRRIRGCGHAARGGHRRRAQGGLERRLPLGPRRVRRSQPAGAVVLATPGLSTEGALLPGRAFFIGIRAAVLLLPVARPVAAEGARGAVDRPAGG